MEDLLAIGDFARLVGLSTSALRFYDECGLLKPTHVDAASGYRYYGHHQVADGEVIRSCRRLRIPLATVRLMLAEPDSAEALAQEFWEAEQEDLLRKAAEFDELRNRLRGRTQVTTAWHLDAEELRKGIGQVAWAAAKPPVKPEVIASVLIECGDEVRLVATDRYRLAIRDLVPVKSEPGAQATAIVDAAALADLAASLPDGDAELVVGQGVLSVSCAGVEHTIPAAHDGYPPYRQLVSDEHNASALVNVDELSGALEALEEAEAVVVDFASGGLQVSAHGEPFTARIAAEVTGEAVRAGFNPRYLLECLVAGDGPEALIQGTSPTAPFVIRSATDGSFTARIMPIRLA